MRRRPVRRPADFCVRTGGAYASDPSHFHPQHPDRPGPGRCGRDRLHRHPLPGGRRRGARRPGRRPRLPESELLRPVAAADKIHAVLLSGGSAFGLDAAGGVMRWLAEHDIGFDTGVAKVPLVCASCLYDLTVGASTVAPARYGLRSLRKRQQLSGRLLRRGHGRFGGQVPRDGAGHENRHRQLCGPPWRAGSGGRRSGERPGRRL